MRRVDVKEIPQGWVGFLFLKYFYSFVTFPCIFFDASMSVNEVELNANILSYFLLYTLPSLS